MFMPLGPTSGLIFEHNVDVINARNNLLNVKARFMERLFVNVE